jgi:hypothetical protein
MNNATKTTPLFKDLSDEALVAEYWAYRGLCDNNAAAAASGAVNVKRAAGQMGKLLKSFDIICALVRRRGLNVNAKA